MNVAELSSFATVPMSDSNMQIEHCTSPAEVGGSLAVVKVAELSSSEQLLRAIIIALARGAFLQAQSQDQDSLHHDPPSFSSVPLEVLLHIISFVGDDSDGLYTKACLALTCSKMYQAYKMVHSGPIAWDVGPPLIDTKGHRWEYALQHHIGVFLGPAYRRHRFDSRFVYPLKKWPAFLSRQAYGNAHSKKEVELNDRYQDWGGLSLPQKPKLSMVIKSLPNPFGLGDEWYALAFKALWKLQINNYADARSKDAGLKGPPRYLFIYDMMMKEYEEFYDGFVEWTVMMGI
ncbi:hypothetical protein ONS95_013790 [Cadophora gregata]|uniref:uncharacterized protein n=1 Tax=Cadophora gregata TaxID=51156 RepID=UPI0026DB082B|nr:uncharacterized protein ONS95_013790 [Cadophora gregata]KAK0114296.1 hypothetical protein ONS95_013790 [Cadophora gregata]